MDIGKKQQIMVDWFRKTLDESKKPWNTQLLPTACRAIRSASAPKATALSSALTCLACPASSCCERCSKSMSRAGNPAGVYRKILTSAMVAVTSTRFSTSWCD